MVTRRPEAEHQQWLARRDAELRAPDGWLTLIGLFWLDDGEQTVGAASDSTIELPSGPDCLGRLRIAGTTAEWHPWRSTSLTLQSDANGDPTVIHHETLSFFLIERDGRLALRLRDTEAPTRLNFAGIEHVDFDPSWQITALWDGSRASFTLGDTACELTPQRADANTLQFVIADKTSGRETYGGGRFLFAARPDNEHLLLDFNRAVNPPCAFTPFAVCPLAPASNRLPVAVTAGEKRYVAA